MYDYLKRKIIAGILIVLVSAFWGSAAEAITISPLRYSVGIDPGNEQTVTVNVLNDSERAKTYTPVVSGFSLDEVLGVPIFDQESLAVDWVGASPKKMTLRPGEESTFTFTITVPAYSEPGVHYVGLLAQEEKEEGQIQVSPRVGTLLFLYIGGIYQEDLTRENFSINKKWQFHSEIALNVMLKNNGNIHVIPEGSIRIKNILGETIVEFEVNKDKKKIIPKQTWQETFTSQLSGIKAVGPLKAELEIDYGLTKQKVYAQTNWWTIPWQYLVVFSLFIVIGIAMLILVLKKARTKRKK